MSQHDIHGQQNNRVGKLAVIPGSDSDATFTVFVSVKMYTMQHDFLFFKQEYSSGTYKVSYTCTTIGLLIQVTCRI